MTLIGYSLPTSDLTFASLLADSLSASSAKIKVVDLVPADVCDRLVNLGLARDRISEVSAKDASPVAEFVSSWRESESRRIAEVLAENYVEHLDDPVLVHWNDDAVGPVIGLRNDGADVVLVVERPTNLGFAIQGRPESAPPLITLRQLLGEATGGRRLTVEDTGAQRQVLIAAAEWKTGVGVGRGVWTALIPSGLPPVSISSV